MAKFKEKIQARKLRRGGESVKEIARKLNVSPASVSIWCRDIALSKNQIKELERRSKDPNYGRRSRYLAEIKRKKDLKIKNLLKEGIKEIDKLSERELFLIGTTLYWTEGFKKDSQAGFANSDPGMIKLFLRWLYECCDYKSEDLSLRVTVNISHKNRIGDIQRYWSDITEISLVKFQKPFYQNVVWKKVYENPNNYYGVLRIKVRKSTDFLRKIHGWIEGLRLQA